MTISAFYLILYFSTPSTSGGLSSQVVPMPNAAVCETAGEKAKKDIGGFATFVRYSCVSSQAHPIPPRG